MNPEEHSRCREGIACTGIGCRVETGKTKRKKNYSRPHPNKREGSRAVAKEGKKR